MRLLLPVLLLALASGCTQQPAPPPAAAVAPEPGERFVEAFPNCEWGEVVAAGVSVWSYACPTVQLVGDENLPGFQLERRDATSGEITRTPAIRILSKPAEAPIASVIDAVRTLSPEAATCEISPGVQEDFVLMPVGDALEAYQKVVRGEADSPTMPCGPMGPVEAGGMTFRVVKGASDKVAVIDWGTELPPFDPDTMRAAPN